MVRNSLSMKKFNYKISSIDYVLSTVQIKYWCEGMTAYNGFIESMPFTINFWVPTLAPVNAPDVNINSAT